MNTIVMLIGLALTLGIPALIALRMPQRRRLATFLAWLSLPLLIILTMILIEMGGSDPQADREKVYFGLAIIASVGAIPWILTCVAGFAIGLALRSRSTASAGEAARPPAAHAVPASPTRPVSSQVGSAPSGSFEPVDPFHSRHVAPDGSLQVDLEAVEWSNSHWVNSPRVTDTVTGHVLLDLWGSDWDAVASFSRPRALALSLRRYHEGGALEAEIDLDRALYTIVEPGGARREGPLSGIADALEQSSHRTAAVQPAATPVGWRSGTAYKRVLLILVSALLAIAALTFLVQKFTPAPMQTLTPMPKPPQL